MSHGWAWLKKWRPILWFCRFRSRVPLLYMFVWIIHDLIKAFTFYFYATLFDTDFRGSWCLQHACLSTPKTRLDQEINKQMIIDNILGLANTQDERFTPFWLSRSKGMTVDIWIRNYNPPRYFQKKISGRGKHNVNLSTAVLPHGGSKAVIPLHCHWFRLWWLSCNVWVYTDSFGILS
jgi:hypothetical protein